MVVVIKPCDLIKHAGNVILASIWFKCRIQIEIYFKRGSDPRA